MLIVFDLDDTLVETSKALTPVKLKAALDIMIKQGLKVTSEKEALATLMEIDRDSPNGTETLQRFIQQKKQNQKFVEIGAKIYYGNSHDIPVKAVPGALDVLAKLRQHHDVVLVSTGMEEEQYRKMKSAEINPHWFSSIILSEEYDKKPMYKKLLLEKKVNPSQSIVCGDKIKTDLVPAKELGMKTVHFQHGRGKTLTAKAGEVDYSISSLPEMLVIVEKTA